MTRTKPVTLNRDVELDGGLLVIPAGTTGTQIGEVDLLHGRDHATALFDFGPPIGRRRVPFPAVDGPPAIWDII